jgi:hypothetical protein
MLTADLLFYAQERAHHLRREAAAERACSTAARAVPSRLHER